MRAGLDFWFRVCAGVFFGLFLLNIFLGKAAWVFGMELILTVGDVGEFLLLLAAVTCFMIEVLRRESQQSDVTTKSADNAGEEN